MIIYLHSYIFSGFRSFDTFVYNVSADLYLALRLPNLIYEVIELFISFQPFPQQKSQNILMASNFKALGEMGLHFCFKFY